MKGGGTARYRVQGSHVFYWRGKSEGSKQGHGVTVLNHNRLERSLAEYFCAHERVISVTLKLNKGYNLKVF